MRETDLAVLEQYNIDVKSTRKARDAFLCETDKGLFLLKEMKVSERRLELIEQLGEHLQSHGCANIDWILRNKEDSLFCTSETGEKYYLKRWFSGRECNVHQEKEVLDGATNLGRLHKAMEGFEAKSLLSREEDLRQEYFRHNRELKKVRSFVRSRAPKSDFELAFLGCFESMYSCAEAVAERLEKSSYGTLAEECRRRGSMIHGEYNYHNLLITYGGMATTNFDRFQQGIPVNDFYYFLRKVMEKNNWNEQLGRKMLECYKRAKPFAEGEEEYLAIRLAYPEKFRKVANSYYRSRKVWLPAKNLEKLEAAIRQTEEKKEFLKNIFAFHL